MPWLIGLGAIGLVIAVILGSSVGYNPGSQGTHPGYSSDVYQAWADQLYMAMNRTGTDEETIFYVLKQLRTPADWRMLVRSFGYRDNTVWLDSFKGGNLVEWFYSELDGSELSEVRNILRNINVII